MWPVFRTRYVHMFAWLGKVTLETYLSQLHIYLQSNAKHLVTYIPGYPLLNFALATVVYMLVSFRLFHITTEVSAFVLPQDRQKMTKNISLVLLTVGVATATAWLLKQAKIA